MADPVRQSVMRRAAVLMAVLGVGVTSFALSGAQEVRAGFHDATYAQASLATEGMAPSVPVFNDQSAGSTLFVTDAGELYVSGMRNSGDGNGNGGLSRQAAAKSDPTHVKFPDGVKIVDAAGSSDDFGYYSSTSYMALDENGGVWTWGQPLGGSGNIGRGAIGLVASYSVGQVLRTADGSLLPRIVDIERSENQFLALDENGTMWSWGYGVENLPRGLVPTNTLPAPSNTIAVSRGTAGCNGGRTVKWHSIWGGNNSSAAVASNGLVYSWGWDNPDGPTNGKASQRCPILNEAANRALFQAYPEQYRSADGKTYDESAPELNGRSTDATLKLRQKRYEEIVSAMEGRTLQACSEVSGKKVADEGGCPVRQFGYSARAPRMLLQNGDLYTWQIQEFAGDAYGSAFLGRYPSNSSGDSKPFWWQQGSRLKPEVALRDVNYVVPGISSVTALTNGGEVYGWGRNNICQAVGGRLSSGRPCTQDVGNNNDVVVLPSRISGLEGVNIANVASTQCATWAIDRQGRTWAWGAGTSTGTIFRYCSPNPPIGGYDTQGYKIYDTTKSTEERPFGEPVTTPGTSTLKVR